MQKGNRKWQFKHVMCVQNVDAASVRGAVLLMRALFQRAPLYIARPAPFRLPETRPVGCYIVCARATVRCQPVLSCPWMRFQASFVTCLAHLCGTNGLHYSCWIGATKWSWYPHVWNTWSAWDLWNRKLSLRKDCWLMMFPWCSIKQHKAISKGSSWIENNDDMCRARTGYGKARDLHIHPWGAA